MLRAGGERVGEVFTQVNIENARVELAVLFFVCLCVCTACDFTVCRI